MHVLERDLNMKLSVIIPCLNGGDTLATQLEALAAQQWSESWELIISDNGSTDDSLEIANTFKDRFSFFRIIDSSGLKRQSHALNVGVAEARADNVAFCDADDEVSPGWLSSIGDALNDHNVVHGQFRFDKFNDARRAQEAASIWKDGLCKKRFLPGGGAGNLGIKRSVHNAVGGFDECIPRFEDSDYYWKLQLEGFKLHYVPEAVIQVRVGRVNPTAPFLYRRYRTGATGTYWLYKKYKHLGMLPPPPLKQSLSRWWRTLRRSWRAGLHIKEKRVAWLHKFAQQTGDLVGQIQGRITNPSKPYHPTNIASCKYRNM